MSYKTTTDDFQKVVEGIMNREVRVEERQLVFGSFKVQ